ncbi:hypothetical protein OPV22_007233 [Ensete ventricosum]|uniref:Uncharacterized protein n=1 Tax=Ensete ventricosum TaxID=4639 RepID=A0AAV8QDT7_ENSVE|nr:hypothetical protein OPV22_007233 [Ensete ventricosum]
MGNRAELQLDAIALAERFELCVIELRAVVGDDRPWEAEPGYDVLPYKPFDLFLGDGGQRLGFEPLGEIVDSDYQEPSLSRGWGEGAEEVHSPLGEGPGAVGSRKWYHRSMLESGVLLA